MNNINSKVFIGLGIAAAAFAGLLIKNMIAEKGLTHLSKEQVIKVLKRVRKQNYPTMRQVATISIQMAQQFQNSVNPEMIEAFLGTPESPINFANQIEKNLIKACEGCGTDIQTFNASIQLFQHDQMVKTLLAVSEKDYRSGLLGKAPQINVAIPGFLNKQKLLDIQNKLMKKTYLFQVQAYKKMRDYTEQQLNSNPELMKDLGNPQQEAQQLLVAEGLGTDDQPAQAVFEAALMRFKGDNSFKIQITKLQQNYDNILKKYAYKMQTKKITELELQTLEDQVIFYEPL